MLRFLTIRHATAKLLVCLSLMAASTAAGQEDASKVYKQVNRSVVALQNIQGGGA